MPGRDALDRNYAEASKAAALESTSNGLMLNEEPGIQAANLPGWSFPFNETHFTE